jgi:Protein of unknown function (DUF2818)
LANSVSVWLVLIGSLFAANLLFVSQRLKGVLRWRTEKGLALRLADRAGICLLVGIFSLLLEQRAGQIAPQGWEFYAITLALFMTFAFPGFVYRYLLMRRGG